MVGFFGLLLLASGCVQLPSSGQAPAAVQATKYVCPDGKTIVENVTSCPPPLSATKELTEQEKALEVCVGMPQLQMGSLEDLCITGVAAKFSDSDICKEVSRDQRLNCYTIVAEVLGDPEICKKADSSMVDQCFNQYASEKKDKSVCEKIVETSSKDRCYEQLANSLVDPELCEKIREVYMSGNCYSNIAMRLGDSSYCEKITNADRKQSCLMNFQKSEQFPVRPQPPK